MKAISQRFVDVPVRNAALPPDVEREYVPLRTEDGKPIAAMLYRPKHQRVTTALIWMHPVVDFLLHYALAPLAARGYATMGVNSRYVNFEAGVIMEELALDLAAAVRYLRQMHYDRILLVGNSGGGALVCFYAAEAQAPTVTRAPDGGGPDLTQVDLPPVDGLILLNAHRGRAQVLCDWIDPAVVDERNPWLTDSTLDMYDPRNQPYSPEFVQRYRAAQRERNRRITRWAKATLAELQASGRGQDLAFVVYRTAADLRFVDLTIDPSDRAAGTYWGDPRQANYHALGLARLTTLRSWLSQWSLDESQVLAEPHLRRLRLPLLILQGTADQGVFKSDVEHLFEVAGTSNKILEWIPGGTHFFTGQPELLRNALDLMHQWIAQRGF